MELSYKAQQIAPSLTLKINSLYQQMREEGQDVVGFGAGEPDFDTPNYIKEAAVQALEQGYTKYTPASGSMELKRAIVKRYERKYGLHYKESQVVVSNGAKHSLYNTFQTILNKGDEVIIIAPYWLTYPELVKMAEGIPVFVEAKEENGFMPCIEDIRKKVSEKTKAIVLNSPSNPTGAVYTKTLLEEIAALAEEQDMLIISDEIYDELDYEENVTSIAQVSEGAKDRTIIVNGMSKAYAMTGWRIGYTLCNETITKLMSNYQSNATSNPCSIAQFASVAALNGSREEIDGMVETFKKRRNLICELAKDIPNIRFHQPKGAFYLFLNITDMVGKHAKGGEITGSLSFAEYLLKEKQVAVVPGMPFGAENYIRLSYACSEENIIRGMERIKEFCNHLK